MDAEFVVDMDSLHESEYETGSGIDGLLEGACDTATCGGGGVMGAFGVAVARL